MRSKLAERGAEPGKGNVTDFTHFVQAETDRYASIVEVANIKQR